MRVIIIISSMILLFSCHNDQTKKETIEPCKLSDTIFNRIPYGINRSDFDKLISNSDNKYLNIAKYKLNADYKPKFYHDTLYTLLVKLSDSVHVKKHAFTYNLDGKTYLGFENDGNVSNEAGGEVLNLFIRKYGKPEIETKEGFKGNSYDEELERINRIEFFVNHKYEWECNSKSITIEFQEKSSIDKNCDKNNEEIITTNSYYSGHYRDFRILYENIKLKTLWHKEEWENYQNKQKREFEEKEKREKKQSEKI